MNSRAFSIAARRIRPSPRNPALRTPTQWRAASSDRQPSNVSEFYKTFTRPVAKVLLMAVFTYQLAYWGWVKLEQDEIRAEREAEVVSLERQVARLRGVDPDAAHKPAEPLESLTLEEAQLRLAGLEKRLSQTRGEEQKVPWWVRR